jgi:hypothetical protein
MTSTFLPHTTPNDERAGAETLFAGLAVPFVVVTLVICAGLVVGGTVGFAMAFGTLLLLVAAVVVGIVSFIGTDGDE